MSGPRFRRSAGGVSSLGLHVVWFSKYRRRLLGVRVAARLNELRAEFTWLGRRRVLWSKSYFAVSVGCVSESTVRRYIAHQCDAVA